MSIHAVELGTFPPRGTPIILQLLPLRVPKSGGAATILWNVTGRYPHGDGSAVCFSATGDDPIGLAHIAGALGGHFKLVASQAIPPTPAELATLGLPGVPALAVLAFDQGTFRQPAQDDADLESFMQTVQTFMDLQARAAAVGVAQFATTIADAEAKKLFLEKLPDSMKVGPHPKTGDYAPACGAKLTVNGPKVEGACINGGPCKLTSSGRCWRWKGTEDAIGEDAAPSVLLTAAAEPGMIAIAPIEVDEAPIELEAAPIAATPTIEMPVPEEAPEEEPLPQAAAPAKKAPAKKKAATKPAPPVQAPEAEADAAPAK